MINITFTADPLPDDFSGSLQDFQNRFLANLHGTIQDTAVLIGQVGGSKPTSNIGPWLNTDIWYIWNGDDYVPTTIKIGGNQYTVTLTNEFAQEFGIIPDKVQTLQDKTGVIALMSDIFQGRPTVILTGTTPTIDWNVSNSFSHILPGNSTYKITNVQDGLEVAIAVKNTGTSYTATWPSTIFWAGTTPPTQTANKTDMYILKGIGGSVFARQIANYA
jgi:hypothetical protein